MADVMDATNASNLGAEASNHLGVSLLKALAKDSGNVFISPLSLSTALAMLHCGCGGETRSEMRKVLGYDDCNLSNEDVASAFSHLLSAWDKVPASYVLSCANSMVSQKTFFVKDEYKLLLQKSFKASLFQADFRTESKKAVKDINEWVKGKTNGMVPQLLNKLAPLTVIVLLNAIYFKGTWLSKFKESSTSLQEFYNAGLKGNSKKVKMMHQKDRFGYVEGESFTALQLPYVGKEIAMLIVLPRSLNGLAELEAQLTPKFLTDLTKDMRQRKVKVALPRFKFEYSKSLVETLQMLGLSKIFEFGADLSGLSDSKNLKVSDVVHKAVIEVNEEGSEAAAATAVVIVQRSLRVDPEFIVDHPFLFTIYDTKGNVILFIGRIDTL